MTLDSISELHLSQAPQNLQVYVQQTAIKSRRMAKNCKQNIALNRQIQLSKSLVMERKLFTSSSKALAQPYLPLATESPQEGAVPLETSSTHAINCSNCKQFKTRNCQKILIILLTGTDQRTF